MFGVVLSWEAHDPDLVAQHFLTVASYNLQHPAQFNPGVIEGLAAAYIAYLDEGLSIQDIRRRVGYLTEGSVRVLLRPEERKPPVLRRWAMTIADVYQAGEPFGAADRVATWAKALRAGLG
jgi:hypothetical protein